MPWELLAIWAITLFTVTWFIRDERRRAADAVLARAAAYYAHAPQYRHISPPAPEPVAPLRRPVGGLTPAQRKFLKDFNA